MIVTCPGSNSCNQLESYIGEGLGTLRLWRGRLAESIELAKVVRQTDHFCGVECEYCFRVLEVSES